jgi:hypothetical protein
VQRLRDCLRSRVLADLAADGEDIASEGAMQQQLLSGTSGVANTSESILVQLEDVPNKDNVNQWRQFNKAARSILQRVPRFKNHKQPQKVCDALTWHFHQMERKYFTLRDGRDPRVWRKAAGSTRNSGIFIVGASG